MFSLLRRVLAAFVFAGATLAAHGQVIINEIHYNPVERPVFNTAGDSVYQGTNTPADLSADVHEFIELHNPTAEPVDLSGWRLGGGVAYSFPSGTTIAPGGYLVIGRNSARIQAVYGISGVLGPFANETKLNNGGDTVRLLNSLDAVSDVVTYQVNFPWAISANKLGAEDQFTGLDSMDYQYKGRSLQRVSPTASSNDPANWLAARPAGPGVTFADLPTPGAANIVTRAVPKPVVTQRAAVLASDGSPIIRPTSQSRITCSFSSDVQLSNVQLEYFIENISGFNEPRQTAPMTLGANGQYSATISGAFHAPRNIIRYRIKADRGDGIEVVSPRPDDPAVVQVGPPSYSNSPAAPNARPRIPAPREPWLTYFVTPLRNSPKPIIDVIVSTDGSPADDGSGSSTSQFNGMNGLQALAFNALGSPKRTTAENTNGFPRETPYVLATDRVWNDVVPGVFASNGVAYDINIRYHGSRWNRRPSRRSYKVFFADYQPYIDAAGVPVTQIFETDKSDMFTTAHGLHREAGLPVSPVRYVDWYFNSDGPITRLEQGEYNGELLDAYHRKMQRLNPGSEREETGEYYKSTGFIVSTNTGGEGPYGAGNAWRLPAAGRWTELERFDYTFALQNHGWVGAKPIRDLVNSMWTARGDNITSTSQSSNPNLAATRAWMMANWDVDTELTSLALGNWMNPWDDTTQNHFLWRRNLGLDENGQPIRRWVRTLWDFDAMYGTGGGTNANTSIYLGEVGDSGNNFRGPNYIKDSFIKAFRNEYRQRMWFVNNTLLDPHNLETLTYVNSSGSTVNYFNYINSQGGGFSVNRFNSVNSQVGLGVFYKPRRPTNTAPANAAALLPGANLTGSNYQYAAAYSLAAAPTVSPHTESRWEIRAANGSYEAPAFILQSAENLTSLPIPFNQLTYGQTYFWRVTYFDANGRPSITSAETSFSYGPASTTAGNVTINEVLAENVSAVINGSDRPDYVELKNNTAAAVDISGWNLTDDELRPARYTFPAGTTIPAGDYLVVWCDSNLAAPGLHTGFGLSRAGQRVILSESGAVRDAVAFGPQIADAAIGRVTDGSGAWTLVEPSPGATNVARSFSTATTDLKINEWMAQPHTGADWFEIYNSGSEPVRIGNLWLSDNPASRKTTEIPALSFIAPRGWVRFDADGTSDGSSSVNFQLSLGGESIVLTAADGITTVDSITFGAQQPNVSQGRLPDGGAAIVSFPRTATPGASNYVPAAVVINEALAASTAPLEDAIELFNPTAAPVDISGWWLSDSQNEMQKFQIPAGTTIPAGGFAVVYENQFNPTPGVGASFAFSANEDVVLSAVDVNGNLTGQRSIARVEGALSGVSFGYIPTAGGGAEFWPLVARTFGADDPDDVEEFRTGAGAANAAPRIGPVMINEVVYHPPDGAGGSDNPRDEFIELLNLTASEVDLSGWQLRGGADFTFPGGTSLPAKGFLLLVSFDPADASLSNAFRAHYGLDSEAQIHGPYAPKLPNSTARIELRAPIGPSQSAIFIDRVDYSDASPWPTSPDGSGPSLQRISRSVIGNDAANWIAATPTPAAQNEGALEESPEINIEQPAGVQLVSGDATVDFGVVTPPGFSSRTFTIRNSGEAELTDISVVIAGADSASFNVTSAPPATVPGSGSVFFTVSFSAPGGGQKDAVLHVTSSDEDENPFFIELTGRGNTAPVAASDVFESVNRTGFEVDVLANDSDSDGDALRVVEVNNVAGGTAAPNENGTAVVFTPATGFTGSGSFDYTIDDGYGGLSSSSATLRDTTPPVLTAPPSVVMNATGSSVAVTYAPATVIDAVTANPVVTYSKASGSQFPLGITTVFVTAVDLAGNQSSAQFTVTLNVGNPLISTLAAKDRPVPGSGSNGIPAGAVWRSFGEPSLDDGVPVFLGRFSAPSGGIQTGIFANKGSGSSTLLVKAGDSAPGVPGAQLLKLGEPLGNGGVAFLATMKRGGGGVSPKTNQGLWSDAFTGATGDLRLIARKGSPAPGVPGANYRAISNVALNEGGRLFWTASLNGGGVNRSNNAALFAQENLETGPVLLLRKGQTLTVAGVPARVKSFTALQTAKPRYGDGKKAGAGATGAGSADGGDRTVVSLALDDKRSAIAAVGVDQVIQILAASGDASVPGIAGARWQSFGFPAAGGSGIVAFRATLQENAGGVSSADAEAIFAETLDAPLAAIVRRGDDAPGMPGLKFASFGDPHLNAYGDLMFFAKLAGPGVTRKTDEALFWKPAGAAALLVAREGSATPGSGGAVIAKFTGAALPQFFADEATRGPVFTATLRGAGVTKKNNSGLWARDRVGDVLLVARTGSQVQAGTIKKIYALTHVLGSPLQARSAAYSPSVVFRAVMTDQSQAILEIRLP